MGTALQVELAQAADVATIHSLRRQLEDWLEAKGIEQWAPGERGQQEIAGQVEDGQRHVVREPILGIIAALRLLREGLEFW